MSSHVASFPPSPAESDVLGEGTCHPTDGVITGGQRSEADSSGVSGTPPLAPAHSAFSSGSSKRCEECAGWDVMMVDLARVYQAKLERRPC
ncbi:hypothetical protein E2C01_080230 [Portunus trituberculatus]|uniref:Uncharacterized protein n=1 Tax=Portunus trituberculatus TaxID=210409 RepID=A0A5B7INR0_PORTR|nr:hypothetical protein [Portunus trituberculatus]